jgi:hypothetical protein
MLLELDSTQLDIDSGDQIGPLHQTNKIRTLVKIFN